MIISANWQVHKSPDCELVCRWIVW